MKLCDINANAFSHLIQIERKTVVPDGQGGSTDEWVADPAEGVYASVKFLTGTERWEASAIQGGDLLRVVTRFRNDGFDSPYYNIGDRIIYRNREFGILSVHDIEFAMTYLQIDCMLGRPT